MPELPEVETTRRGIEGPLVGCRVASCTVRNGRLRLPVPADIVEHLSGAVLRGVRRRAKYLLLDFDHGSLIVHLGMSGSLRIVPPAEPPGRHDHIDLIFQDRVLRYRDPRRFGMWLWQAGEGLNHPLLLRLGVEPLEEGFNPDDWYRATRGVRTPIKLVLMDGHRLVGVGNIYASESLFRAGIGPTTQAGRLGRIRCERLVASVKETLNDAIAAGGSTLRDFIGGDGQPGYFQQQYFVYGRQGQACRVCATPVCRSVMGQRATYWCPVCQPAR